MSVGRDLIETSAMNHFFQGGSREPFLKCVRVFEQQVTRNLDAWKLDQKGNELLRYIRGNLKYDRFAANLASNLATRHYAASQLRFAIRRLRIANPGCRFRHLTLVHNGWRTADRETNVDLESVKRTVGQLLHKSGLEGWVGVVEIQAEAEHKSGKGRDLMPHAHLLIWSRDDDFDFGALERQLRASKRLEAPLGAATAKITGDDSTPDRGPWRWIWYFFKPPAYAKNPVPKPGKPGQFRYMGATIRDNLAVRLIEVLSRLRLDELIMGSGEGRAIAEQLRKDIREKTKAAKDRYDDYVIDCFWFNARKKAEKTSFKRVTIQRWKSDKRTQGYKRGPYRQKRPPGSC